MNQRFVEERGDVTGGTLFTDSFAVGAVGAVGAVVTVLIALAFFLDRRLRLFSFFGTAIVVITGAAGWNAKRILQTNLVFVSRFDVVL